MQKRNKIPASDFLWLIVIDLIAAVFCRLSSNRMNRFRTIEIAVLALGALLIVVVSARWAPDLFVVDASSDVILNATWVLLEFVALILGIGVTISPFALLIRLSGVIPRGDGTRKIQIAALTVSSSVVVLAVALYTHLGNAMTAHALQYFSFVFALLPGYLFITAGTTYGLIVLIARRYA